MEHLPAISLPVDAVAEQGIASAVSAASRRPATLQPPVREQTGKLVSPIGYTEAAGWEPVKTSMHDLLISGERPLAETG